MWLILIFYSCVPFDVVLPESELMLGCFQCSKETSVKVIINDQSFSNSLIIHKENSKEINV